MIRYSWPDAALELVLVTGQPYQFGEGGDVRLIEVRDFYIATTPVTQVLWEHVMGSRPSCNQGPRLPLENVSWDEVTGFFASLRDSEVGKSLMAQADGGEFRLPSEAEWEYAARGGPHWRDGFRFSGGDDIDAVAWYGRRDGHTHPVAEKAANQLGLFDMSGNVWEWCQDAYDPDVSTIPADGKPRIGDGPDRVLRGGCFHNWAVHCTVSKRYQIERQFHDGCIGFRVVLG